MNANDIRTTITNTIIESLEAGGLPAWRKTWAADPNGLGLATSLSTGKQYNGINQLLLQVLAMKHGYQCKWFGTFNQIKSAGASVKKGEKAIQIVLFRPITRDRINEVGEQTEDKFFVMRTFNVFNVQQTTDGLDQFRIGFAQPTNTIFERFEMMDRLVEAANVYLRHGGNKAFYSPSGHYIQMPFRHQFESSEAYYATLAHEMIHHTEKAIEFDRSQNDAYALGELVAELGSSFLLAELGLPASENMENCAAYLQHWLKAMKGDTKFIFKAAATASKAVEHLLSHVRVLVTEEVGTC